MNERFKNRRKLRAISEDLEIILIQKPTLLEHLVTQYLSKSSGTHTHTHTHMSTHTRCTSVKLVAARYLHDFFFSFPPSEL